MIDACGGPRETARELRIHYQTLWRWALRGDPVPPAMKLLIEMVAARLGVLSPV